MLYEVITLLTLIGAIGGLYFVSQVQLGESEPGSPLLHRNHDYNISTTAINERFPGSEELHVSARTEEKGGIKRPDVMAAIERFQAHMLDDPALGGTKALPGVVRVVNKLTHNDDPRWMQIPDSRITSYNVCYTKLLRGGGDPGEIKGKVSGIGGG